MVRVPTVYYYVTYWCPDYSDYVPNYTKMFWTVFNIFFNWSSTRVFEVINFANNSFCSACSWELFYNYLIVFNVLLCHGFQIVPILYIYYDKVQANDSRTVDNFHPTVFETSISYYWIKINIVYQNFIDCSEILAKHVRNVFLNLSN